MSDIDISIISHKGCMDGCLSAYLVVLYARSIGKTYEIHEMHYGDPLPACKGHTIYIVDFSFDFETLQKLAQPGKKLYMHDHHASAFDMYATNPDCTEYYLTHENIEIVLRSDLSGCGIVANYLSVGPLPVRVTDMVRGIQDRDLWLFKYPDSKAYHTMLSKVPFTVPGWDALFNEDGVTYAKRFAEAKATVSYIESAAHKAASKATIIKFQGCDVPIVNCTSLISDTCEAMYSDKYPISMSYFITGEQEVVVSLRSISTKFDVKSIAAKFEGGGHLSAAAFKMPLSKLPSLLNGQL